MDFLAATPYLVEFLKRNHLDQYLVYGSYAYCYFTKQNVAISDIDIVVSRNCFRDIIKSLEAYRDEYEIFDTGKSLHINIKALSEGGEEPFGFSIDSYEDYFSPALDLSDSKTMDIDGENINLMKISDLISRYDKDSLSNHPKASEYRKKVKILREV
jgi:hypothetical protein